MKRFALIGKRLGPSVSPRMHNAAFRAQGIDAVYEKIEVDARELGAFIKTFPKNFSGANVTVPYKETIIPHLTLLDSVAKAIGAVNTLVVRDGEIIGYNTDWEGAMLAVLERTPLRDQHVCVIGAGGAARAIVYGLLRHGARPKILNRTVAKAKKLGEEFGCEHGNLHDIPPCDILINTTVVGMSPLSNKSPVPSSVLPRIKVVFDIVYNPLQTRLLREAHDAGCVTISGLSMLIHQAAISFRLWTGQTPDISLLKNEALRALEVVS